MAKPPRITFGTANNKSPFDERAFVAKFNGANKHLIANAQKQSRNILNPSN